MPMFRKKPTDIEAWQWNGEKEGQMRGVCQCVENTYPHLHTAHDIQIGAMCTMGQMVFLSVGDWIIPEAKAGRFYPCKPEVFAATYEPVVRQPMDWKGRPTTLEAMDAEMARHAPGIIAEVGTFTDEDLRAPQHVVWMPRSTSVLPDGHVQDPVTGMVTAPDGRVLGVPLDWRSEPFEMLPAGTTARLVELMEENGSLQAQLLAEGEHTAAANANIDRLNTEIERVTRRQQGPLMGKD